MFAIHNDLREKTTWRENDLAPLRKDCTMTYFNFSAEIVRSEPGGPAIINKMDAEMVKLPTPLFISDMSQEFATDRDDPVEDEVYFVDFSLSDSLESSEPIFEFAPALGVDPIELAELCDEMIDAYYGYAHNDN